MVDSARLNALHACFAAQRQGQSLMFASASLLLFDYVLTFYDELRYVWGSPHTVSLAGVAFFLARYPALACIILELFTYKFPGTIYDNIITVLKLVSIISSEFILAVRTWAIWQRSRHILIVLVFFSASAVIPAAVIIGWDISTTEVAPPFVEGVECRILFSAVRQGYIVPFLLTIVYEFVTLSLSIYRILRWRRSVPADMHIPLLDTLWNDGILYFSWMIVLGFLNIGLLLQSASQQLRSASALLQMVFHSVLATRIVLHLSDSAKQSTGLNALTTSSMWFTSHAVDIHPTDVEMDVYPSEEMPPEGHHP